MTNSSDFDSESYITNQDANQLIAKAINEFNLEKDGIMTLEKAIVYTRQQLDISMNSLSAVKGLLHFDPHDERNRNREYQYQELVDYYKYVMHALISIQSLRGEP